MSAFQFLRVECCGLVDAAGIIAEANREPLASKHVAEPKPVRWLKGRASAVAEAIQAYMDERAPVRNKSGSVTTRRRRKDHRCLVSGIVTHPTPTKDLTPDKSADGDSKAQVYERQRSVQDWLRDSALWLNAQWGARLIGICVHVDESHPHLHFFVVGDAQRLHPGLRAELVNDRRIEDRKARSVAHKQGLKLWLDDYHRFVACKHGLERGDGSVRPLCRIKRRSDFLAMTSLQEDIALVRDAEVRAELERKYDELYDSLEKVPTERLKY